MYQICYVCKKCYGVKPPYDDESETHGICPECFPGELKKIEEALEKK
jgi:hypothetical protein